MAVWGTWPLGKDLSLVKGTELCPQVPLPLQPLSFFHVNSLKRSLIFYFFCFILHPFWCNSFYLNDRIWVVHHLIRPIPTYSVTLKQLWSGPLWLEGQLSPWTLSFLLFILGQQEKAEVKVRELLDMWKVSVWTLSWLNVKSGCC